MTSIIDTSRFLQDLKLKGIHLSLEGENLRLSAPREAVTEAIRNDIRKRKPQIIELLSCLGSSSEVAKPPIPRADRSQPIPLSFAQQRLYFMQQFNPEDPAYNLPSAFRFRGELDPDALQAALWLLEERHEILRTSFEVSRDDHETPFQVIHPPIKVPFARLDLSVEHERVADREAAAQAFAEAQFNQPFQLDQAPLYRVWLLKMAEDHSILLMSMHHIISDAWSMNLMMQELVALYHDILTGNTPQATPDSIRQYADFAAWQRDTLSGDAYEKQCRYWQDQLTGSPVALDLPTDVPRPATLSYAGAVHHFEISPALTASFRDLIGKGQATMSMGVQALFALLMARYSGESDINVGHTIANRNHPDLEGLLGFFVNTLVLRTSLADAPSFQELLSRVRRTSLAAYEHQDVPFERVVEMLAPPRLNNLTPVFQVMCDLQNARVHYPELDGLKLEPVEWGTRAAKFDLSLDVEENQDRLHGLIEYRLALFENDTIESMARHFQNLMQAVVDAPDRNVWDLVMLDDGEVLPERHRLDRDKLKAPASDLKAAVAPRNATEQVLADLFREVLGIEVAIHDSFFERGGHSLLAARLLSRIRRHFNQDISLPLFFEGPTVAQLATYLEVLDWSQSEAEPETDEALEMGVL